MSGDEGVKTATPKRAALGRGLGALLGETRREEALSRPKAAAAGADGASPIDAGTAGAGTPGGRPTTGVALLSVSDIEPHPEQPRRHFDEEALDELAQSIAARGVIQPVIVRPMAGGRYQLVHEIPAIVRDLSERDVTALALIENLQREDLNPVEEARAYQRLADTEGLTQQEIARFVDKSRSHVANMMRLLVLPDAVLDMVQREELTMGHARALAVVPEPLALAQEIVGKGLSVRDAERLAKRATRPESAPRRVARAERDPASAADIAAVQAHVEEFLGLKVVIHTDADPRSGTVEIRYKTLDQLDLICQRLTGGAI